LFGADIFLELNQEAFPADERIQQKIEFNRVDLFRIEETLAQRRHSKIDEAVLQIATHMRPRPPVKWLESGITHLGRIFIVHLQSGHSAQRGRDRGVLADAIEAEQGHPNG
jgi:hypothetical protein